MWGATKKSLFIQSSAKVPPRDEHGGPDWRDVGLGRLVHLVSLVYPVGLVQLNKPNEPARRAGCVRTRVKIN